MRALLAIDDGLSSPDVAVVRRSLLESGVGVVTIGAESRGRVVAGQRPATIEPIGDDQRNPIFKMDGSPTDGVHFALGSGLIEPVHVVIAAFARAGGAESANAAAAGAEEAASLGVPAIVLALGCSAAGGAAPTRSVFEWGGVVLSELAAWMIASPMPRHSVLKVTLPEELTGRGLQLACVTEIDPRSGGHVTVQPISVAPQDGHLNADLSAWVERALAAINPRLGVGDSACSAGCCG